MEEVGRPCPHAGRKLLEKVRGRYISTLQAIPAEEFASGISAMERELEQKGDLGDCSWRASIVSTRIERHPA